ncbi:MAG: twin transmembrane helix small protein [Alphaproteobacteria bacterium]|nr:MAG: twin transmembrane helix small protein [Alphaproteobacteria bacterium]
MNWLVVLIIAAALATLAVLGMGVVTMARGRDITGKKSNKLMQMRVLAQAITIVLIIIFIAVMADR